MADMVVAAGIDAAGDLDDLQLARSALLVGPGADIGETRWQPEISCAIGIERALASAQ
jgi:hypothetical protein